MSTRCRIALEQEDGTVKSIYCHYDGYPEGVGVTLKNCYCDPAKIEELLELGDLFTLGTAYDKELAERFWKAKTIEEKREMHARTDGMTIPYKDGGEGSFPRIDTDRLSFIKKLGDHGEEFSYLFAEDYGGVYRWLVCETPWFEPLRVEGGEEE